MPGFLGWDRGAPDYFGKWLKKPPGHRNEIHWSTSGQHVGPYQPGGADPNQFTQKYDKRSADSEDDSNSRRKREAEAEPQYLAT